MTEFEKMLNEYSCDPKKFYSCESKKRFGTRAQAEDKSWQWQLELNRRNRVYYCKNCNGYHLTTKVRKKR